MTHHLERLQAGVEKFGRGDLSARVNVEGRDEVARLAMSFNRATARSAAYVILKGGLRTSMSACTGGDSRWRL